MIGIELVIIAVLRINWNDSFDCFGSFVSQNY